MLFSLCTLFNSQYLDKGIALYHSLEAVSDSFSLYVLAMDDKCYEVLTDLAFPHMIPIRLSDFENERLLHAKSNRSFGEYCWTCSSSLIRYVFDKYSPDYCGYIDADMKFYSNPMSIIEEMESKKASVSIVGHRFGWYAKKSIDIYGRYCVECNVFKNDINAITLLDIWINQCIEDCSRKADGIHYGDQKYLDNWVRDYDFVIETENLGAGIAPWNIPQYTMVSHDGNTITVKCNRELYNILFYHFEGITYETPDVANIHLYSRWGIDDKLVDLLYDQYLNEVYCINQMLSEKYGLNILLRHHPALEKKSRREIIKNRLKILISGGIVGLFFHIIPRLLYYKKDTRVIAR